MDSLAQASVFLVTGNDEASIEAESAALVSRVAGPDADAFRLEVYREREGIERPELLRRLTRSLLAPPFLGDRKTVWLRGYSGFAGESDRPSPRDEDAAALRELADRVAAGFAPGVVLVLSGPGADPAKPLATACAARGRVILCQRPSLRDRNWRDAVRELIARRAAEKGVRLPPDVLEYLAGALGTDTDRIAGELEKLICYAGGPDKPIRVEDAQEVCPAQAEELPWALTNALGRRDAGEALRVLPALLERMALQSRDERRDARTLLGQLGRYVRDLLQVKVFMAARGIRSPEDMVPALKHLTPDQKRALEADGLRVLGENAFRCKALAADAGRYSGQELVAAVQAVHDACLACITSGTPERVALEEVVVRIARPASRPAPRR